MVRLPAELNTTVVPGVGGSFEVVASKVNRAPAFQHRPEFEWFDCVNQERGRLWRRYLVTNTVFGLMVLKSYIGCGVGRHVQ